LRRSAPNQRGALRPTKAALFKKSAQKLSRLADVFDDKAHAPKVKSFLVLFLKKNRFL
jgi:hypothetical protein